ncbi:MAG: hypothetical protein ACREDU_09630 [Methylocella sp.]
MRPFTLFCVIILCAVLAAPAFGQFVPKQPTLDDQAAVITAKRGFESLWYWETTTQSRYLKFTIPVNPFTPVLGQNGPIVRFLQAYNVGYDVHSQTLTSADLANGFQWDGKVTFTAERYRIYDMTTGWQTWINNGQLDTYTVKKKNDSWSVVEEYLPMIPQGVQVQIPTSTELPRQNEDPRVAPSEPPPASRCRPCERPTADGRCVQWRACY